jgi:CheY-like chemotaxis protein
LAFLFSSVRDPKGLIPISGRGADGVACEYVRTELSIGHREVPASGGRLLVPCPHPLKPDPEGEESEMSTQRVMFVDDDEGVRISWDRYLTSIGLDVSTAETAETAIAQLEREEVDVVVSDLRMPGMDGLDFLRVVKERWPRIQLILLTGYGNPDVEGAVHDLGGSGYLSKPIDPEMMAETIQEAFEKIRDIPKMESEVEDMLHKTDIPTKHALKKNIEVVGALALSPIIGLAFVVFLPIIGFAAIVYRVGETIQYHVISAK